MKKKHLLLSAAAFVAVVAGSVFTMTGCEKEHTANSLDPAIANSPELEAYVIAGYDLQQSIIDLRAYFSTIDLSKLEWVEEDGRMVMHLPGFPPRIEDKVAAFNDEKSILLKKFPQITSFPLSLRGDYVQYCTQNSVTVNDKLFDLGINVYQLRTKARIDEWMGIFNFLDGHMGSDDYVEVVIIGYADGGCFIYKHGSNTSTRARYPMFSRGSDGMAYYPEGGNNSAVIMVAHTHRDSSTASPQDKEVRYTEFAEAIYYNGSFYRYNND